VTIDAMGCQREIVKQIREGGGDYVIALKKNQGGLYERVEALFQEALIKKYQGFTFSSSRLSEPGHGREETRYCMMLSDIQNKVDPEGKWQELLSVGRQDAMRVVKGKATIETRYFISSLPNNAELLADSIRQHWGVENSLHWGGVSAGEYSPAEPPLLDVAFREDDSRIRKDNAPQNFAVLRHIAVNLLQQDKSVKTGVKNKRLRAGWDNEYLAKILSI